MQVADHLKSPLTPFTQQLAQLMAASPATHWQSRRAVHKAVAALSTPLQGCVIQEIAYIFGAPDGPLAGGWQARRGALAQGGARTAPLKAGSEARRGTQGGASAPTDPVAAGCEVPLLELLPASMHAAACMVQLRHSWNSAAGVQHSQALALCHAL